MLQLFVSKQANRVGIRLEKTQNSYFLPGVRKVPLDDLLFAWRGEGCVLRTRYHCLYLAKFRLICPSNSQATICEHKCAYLSLFYTAYV